MIIDLQVRFNHPFNNGYNNCAHFDAL